MVASACYTGHMDQSKPPSLSLNVRMPTDMHATIKAQATAEDRSLNGQIVHLLRYALSHYQPPQ